jgi:glycine C-acetyltransferase/8-amino-7-oxononanoate synthase
MAYLMESPPAARTLINGRWRDYFAGCGYLGLQGHPELLSAAAEVMKQYGLTIATSRGGYGENPIFQTLEQVAARFFEAERATYFVSGYLGNATVPATSFRHLAAEDLDLQCRANLRPGERPLVISDGIFPISGEIAPVPDYVAVLAAYEGAILCLDDAHATGVIGQKGQGTLEYYGLQGERRYTTHTLSKALAGHGGIIAGQASLIEKLGRNSSVPGATSPAPLPVAGAATRALHLVTRDPGRRRQLWRNVSYARAALRELGWPLPDTPVPIICLGARPGLDLGRLQAELFTRDICLAHVTSYSSTPPGGALRIAIFATHTTEQIDRLVAELGNLLDS